VKFSFCGFEVGFSGVYMSSRGGIQFQWMSILPLRSSLNVNITRRIKQEHVRSSMQQALFMDFSASSLTNYTVVDIDDIKQLIGLRIRISQREVSHDVRVTAKNYSS
jgi:hypothetical protein